MFERNPNLGVEPSFFYINRTTFRKIGEKSSRTPAKLFNSPFNPFACAEIMRLLRNLYGHYFFFRYPHTARDSARYVTSTSAFLIRRRFLISTGLLCLHYSLYRARHQISAKRTLQIPTNSSESCETPQRHCYQNDQCIKMLSCTA